MSTQNPIIPTPLQAQGIDAVIQDIQTHLDFDLSWLTNGMGQGYRLAKVRTPQNIVFLPEVYLGTTQNKYFSATPDNDKTGQSVFIIGTETLPNYQTGFFGYLEYEMSILFTANLKLIDSTLLETEDFTEHLISDVRQSIIRNLLGKTYRVTIDSIERGFENTYSDFDIANDRGISYLPLTHFRLNCTVQVKEDCVGTSLNRCTAITQNLTQNDLLTCILPLYDFAQVATQNALSIQQILDLKTWLLPQYDFSDVVWQNLLTAQQESDLTAYLLPLVDFTDVAIQAIITPQQQSDIIAWLLPLVDFSDPSIQAIITPTQQTDLQTWLCTPAPPTFDYSFLFNGVNQYIIGQTGGVYNLDNNTPFSISVWFTATSLASTIALLSKAISQRGYSLAITTLGKVYLDLRSGSYINGNCISVISNNSFTAGVLNNVTITYSGNQLASGVEIYLNGVASTKFVDRDGLGGTLINAQNIQIGATTTYGFYSNASINQCRMWDIALSPANAAIEGLGTLGKPNATAVNAANLIMNTDFDTSVFGFDTFSILDSSGASSGYKTINAPFNSRFVQP